MPNYKIRYFFYKFNIFKFKKNMINGQLHVGFGEVMLGCPSAKVGKIGSSLGQGQPLMPTDDHRLMVTIFVSTTLRATD